jgi:tetratricopeptide (TPR) repeat protein
MKNDNARAALDYDEVTRISPTNASAWNSRCWVRALMGQLEQALKDCDESLRLRPNDPNTLDSRGLVYLKLADHDKAIADYDAVVKLKPQAAGALYGRGVAKNKKQGGSGDDDLAAAKAINAKIAETFAVYGVK